MELKACNVCGKICTGRVGKICGPTCQSELGYREWKLQVDKTGKFNDTVRTCTPRQRRYLTETRGYRCEICGITGWLGEKIVLIFDHINGDPYDWAVSNCRFVCPNCDSQLPTFKNKNRGKGRTKRGRDTHRSC